MWMLGFLPDAFLFYAVIAVLAVGVGLYVFSFFLNFFPPFKPYRVAFQALGTVLAVAGVYFYGSYATEMEWRERVAETEKKIAIAEAKSKEANVQIQTKIVERVKVVKEKEIVIQKEIVEAAAKMDEKCVVIPEALDILNQAAKTPGESK